MDLFKIIVDASTGEKRIVDLTQEEIDAKAERLANAEADALAREEEKAAAIALKESAKAKLLALGLSEEEVSAIIGI
jgi:hypothetical protein